MLKLAEMLASKRKLELLKGQHGIEAEYDINVDFIAYARNFIANHLVKETKKYYAALKKMTAFAGKERIACFEITESFLRKFVQNLDLQMRGEACHNYFSKLKQIITAATKDCHFRVNPATDIKIKKRVFLQKDVVNYEEIRLLARTSIGNDEVKRAFLFCCLTGLRHCDVKVLTWKNVKSNLLHVMQAKTKILAYITLIFGTLISIYGIAVNLQNAYLEEYKAVGIGILSILISVTLFVCLMALSEMIKLFINSADNLQSLASQNLEIKQQKVFEGDKQLIDWLRANPDKGINDYYARTV